MDISQLHYSLLGSSRLRAILLGVLCKAERTFTLIWYPGIRCYLVLFFYVSAFTTNFLLKPGDFLILICQTIPKGVTTQMKALDEYFLTVKFL